MKRRNAETGKLRRPVKRTKIVEGMYGNSLVYLKFVMVWATVVLADYMLEFRFEFLWPFWMMLKSVYDSFRYQGIAFSVFFICIALTSDMICFFYIPLQYLFFAASTYVWVHYVWYTFGDKSLCVPHIALCCMLVYMEGAWRGARPDLCRPFAAHAVGYPVITLGFSAKALIGHRLRARRQRQVRALNEFYFQLMRDALPDELAQNETEEKESGKEATSDPCGAATADARQNGAVRRRCKENGHCPIEHQQLHVKLERLEKHLAQHTANKEREKLSSQSASNQSASSQSASTQSASCQSASSPLSNGSAVGNGSACHAADEDEHKHEVHKGSTKSSKLEKKEASSLKEERRKNKNRDKDKESIDSHKSTDNNKEQIFKEFESTKECVKIKECSNKDKEKEREREREKETRDKERERELKEAKSCAEELKRAKAELSVVKAAEAEAKRALAAAAAAERQRRAEHYQLKQAHATLQNKVSTWRTGERATLERRLGEERRARTHAENQLLRARHAPRTPSGECESESCRAARVTADTESATLRRDLQRARDRALQLQRDLSLATEQVRSLEGGGSSSRGWHALHERAAHLERALSAETRVKLDLLSALGDAKRRLHIQDGLISKHEKEMEELKAQMLAVMPTEFVSPVTGVSKLRLSDGSPLDPNASVYTPKQLCSDA